MMSSERTKTTLPTILAFAMCFGLLALLAWHGNAFRSEFGESPDAPAHYVTGLMVHDYIAAGMPWPPMRYAENYYLHYPKVALGHWPPVFYIVQTVWTFVFSTSRVSIVLLMAALSALVACLVFRVVAKEFSALGGVAVALIWVSIPLVETLSRAVMSEVLVALLVFLAVLAYGKYIDTGRWQYSAWFSAFACLALLTKGTGIELSLVPPLAVLLTGRWRWLWKPSFWLPVPVVVLICGPWYKWAPESTHSSVAAYGGVRWIRWNLWVTPAAQIRLLGPLVALTAAIGILVWVPRLRREGRAGIWAAGLALLMSVFFWRLWIMVWDVRHLVSTFPILLIFAAAGTSWLFSHRPLTALSRRTVSCIVGLPVLAILAVNIAETKPLHPTGFASVAADLVANPRFRNSVFLVSSGAGGEGMFIAEVAMREQRPGHIVLRGTKALATSDWLGDVYEPLYRTPAELMQYLDSIPVGVLIIDQTADSREHERLLMRVVQDYADQWERIATYPRAGEAGRPISVYFLRGSEGRPINTIRLKMPYTLKHDIVD